MVSLRAQPDKNITAYRGKYPPNFISSRDDLQKRGRKETQMKTTPLRSDAGIERQD